MLEQRNCSHHAESLKNKMYSANKEVRVVKWLFRDPPVSVRRYEVEAAVDSAVLDVFSVDPALCLVVLLKLPIHIINDGLPPVHTKYSITACWWYINTQSMYTLNINFSANPYI